MRVWAAVVVLVLAGCATPAAHPTSSATPSPPATVEQASPVSGARHGFGTPLQPDPKGSPAEAPPWVLDQVRDDLALQEVDASTMIVISSRSVTWADESLGCPTPGKVYAQALVPGLHLVVEADSVQYDYRIPDQGSPQLCLPLPLR